MDNFASPTARSNLFREWCSEIFAVRAVVLNFKSLQLPEAKSGQTYTKRLSTVNSFLDSLHVLRLLTL